MLHFLEMCFGLMCDDKVDGFCDGFRGSYVMVKVMGLGVPM